MLQPGAHGNVHFGSGLGVRVRPLYFRCDLERPIRCLVSKLLMVILKFRE